MPQKPRTAKFKIQNSKFKITRRRMRSKIQNLPLKPTTKFLPGALTPDENIR